MTVPDSIEQFASAIGPRPDEVLTEMDRHASETDFPTVGPAVGGWLQQLAGLVGADRIFEFGSGFGYSAYWFSRALPPDGEIVLTEIDADELDSARSYLGRGGYTDRAKFELGDAIETIDSYAGPFDVVLIDNEKDRYVEAFEAVRSKVPVDGVVVADNAIAGPFEFETMRRIFLEDEQPANLHDSVNDTDIDAAQGIVEYLEHLRVADGFETVLLPLGEGLTVSRRVE